MLKNAMLENAMLKNENEQITERVNNLNLVLADLQNKASSAEEEKYSLITSIRLLYKDLESTQPMNTNTIAKVDEQSNRYQSDKHHVSADEAGGGHYTNIPTKNRYSALSVDEANAENVPKKPDASTNLSSPEQRSSERKNAKQSCARHNENPKNNMSERASRKIAIVGDSMLKHLKGYKMSKENKVKISTFPGSTTRDMFDYIKPVIRKKPDQVIIHVGTNSLRECESSAACAEEIAELAKSVGQLSITPEPEVIISSLIFRSDDSRLGKQINEVNSILSKLCGQYHWKFIDHSNITQKHLNRSGLHLNTDGTSQLARNFLNVINLSN